MLIILNKGIAIVHRDQCTDGAQNYDLSLTNSPTQTRDFPCHCQYFAVKQGGTTRVNSNSF